MAQDAVQRELVLRPAFAKGAGVTQVVRRVGMYRKSDDVDYSDTTVVNLFNLPGDCLITDVIVRVKTAFDASGTSDAATATITIPNDTGTETIWNANNIALQTTGWKRSVAMALTPATGGLAALNYTAGTATAGQLQVYLVYVENDSDL